MNRSGWHQVAAVWHTCRGRRDNALVYHRATLDQDPAHWSALCFVLEQLRREGRDADALAVAQRALQSESDHFLALWTAARLSVKLGGHREGKHYVERALAVWPDIRTGSMPVMDGVYRIASRAARFLRGGKALRVASEAPSWTTARQLEDRKQWALGYLAWCKATEDGGQRADHEEQCAPNS